MSLGLTLVSLYCSHKSIGYDTDKTNWNLFPKICDRLNQWALTPLGPTLSIKSKEVNLITIDDNIDEILIYLQTDGTNSKSSSKFYDGLTQWELIPLGLNPTGWTEHKMKLINWYVKQLTY